MRIRIASGMALLTAFTPAYAQDRVPDAADAPTSEEIIVTAQRRAQNVQDVPIAITPVTEEVLAARDIDDIRDLAIIVPSFNVSTTFANALPRLRGVGPSFAAGEGSIAFYVDDVYYGSAAASALTFNNVAQIDVLKGPQGTLFGRNATGGLLQVTTLTPSETPAMRASVSLDNYDMVQTRGYVTAGIMPGVAADLAVQYTYQGDGYGINQANGAEVNRINHDFGIRSKWVIEPGSGTRVTLIGDYSDLLTDRGPAVNSVVRGPFAPLSPPGSNPFDTLTNESPFVAIEIWGVSGQLEQDLGGVELTSITAYREQESVLFIDGEQSPFRFVNIAVNSSLRQFTQEVRLASDNGNRGFQWLVGAFYLNGRSTTDPFQISLFGPFAPPPFTSFQLSTSGEERTSSIAGFAEGTVNITDSTRLTLGGRITKETRRFNASQTALANGVIPIPVGAVNDAELEVTEPTWRIILDHRLSEQLLLYASYNRGFRSGLFNTNNITDPPLDPEILDAYEAGFKSTLFDGRVRFNAAGFYYDYQNYQVLIVSNGVVFFDNTVAEIYGAEAELQARVTENFNLNASFGWVHARYTSYPGCTISTPNPAGGNIQTNGDCSGNRISYVPDFTFAVGANYSVPAFGGRLVFDANYFYNDGFFTEADNRLRQGSYELVTASVAWTDPGDHFTVRLFGNNLTDSLVANQITSSAFGSIADYQPPRTYGVELGIRF